MKTISTNILKYSFVSSIAIAIIFFFPKNSAQVDAFQFNDLEQQSRFRQLSDELRCRAETVLLWFGPLIFLLIGGFVAHGIYRKAAVADDGRADSLSDEQEAQISELVGNTGKAE